MVSAAADGKEDDPNVYRDYRLRTIMKSEGVTRAASFAWLSFDYFFSFCVFA